MINKKYRFHGHNSLNFLFRKGRNVRTEFISMRYAPSRNDDFRLAVIVSKKVAKSAVVRNRIRRRLYEIVRKMHKDAAVPWKFDISITVYDERIAKIPTADLESTILKLFQKAKII